MSSMIKKDSLEYEGAKGDSSSDRATKFSFQDDTAHVKAVFTCHVGIKLLNNR